jgi:ribosomal protein L29
MADQALKKQLFQLSFKKSLQSSQRLTRAGGSFF